MHPAVSLGVPPLPLGLPKTGRAQECDPPFPAQTRILVTHTHHVLPQADCIVVLAEGAIAEMGTYQELLRRKGALVALLEAARWRAGGAQGGRAGLWGLRPGSCHPREGSEGPAGA